MKIQNREPRFGVVSFPGLRQQSSSRSHMDEQKVLKTIAFEKDVDGFSATNLGNLALKATKTDMLQ